MTGHNGKRFALVGMLAGALILGGTQAAAQGQSGTSSSIPNSNGQSSTGPYPESTTPRDQTLMPPDVIDQTGTGGSGNSSGDLPSRDDALRTPRTGTTTTDPNTREPNTSMQGNTSPDITPDNPRRDTALDPGTGGSGTAGTDNMRKDDSTLRPDGLGTDLNKGTTDQGTLSPDSVYKDNAGAKTR